MKFKMGGSGIHIKPENKGKFTATKKATGKSTEELTHSKNPVTKKRAVFAQNAAKFKHADGSKGVKSFPDLNKDGKISRADVLVGRGVIPAKKMQMGSKSTKTKYTEEENKKYLQKAGGYVHSPEQFEKRGIKDIEKPIRPGASADSTGYFARKIDNLEKMEKSVIKNMNNTKAPATKIPKEVENRKLSKSDEFAHKYLTSQPKILGKIRAAKDEAKDNYFRQENKGDKGIIFNYDKDGHFVGPKSSNKKMAMGVKNTKSFPDLNKDGKITQADILKGRGVIKKTGAKSMKVDEMMCGSKGMKYADGTKKIKFKKPMMKRADGSTSQRGLYDNIRANKGSGKKPTPEMLKQEKKIKAKTGK